MRTRALARPASPSDHAFLGTSESSSTRETLRARIGIGEGGCPRSAGTPSAALWDVVGAATTTPAAGPMMRADPNVSSPSRPPTVSITIRTRVTAQEYELLRQLAEEDCSNIALLVRRMVRRGLGRLQHDPESRHADAGVA